MNDCNSSSQALTPTPDPATPLRENAGIKHHHYQEWIKSGVDPEIIYSNIVSLEEENKVLDLLLYADNLPRRNDGRLTDGILKNYRFLSEAGGWYCSGLDPITLEDSHWGCFKPDRPRLNKDGKVIKYEHPPKVPTEVFCLRVTRHIWRKVAKKAGGRLSRPCNNCP